MEHCEVCGLLPFAPRLRGATRIVAESAAMRELLRRVARFAASDAPILIGGETGTGKEVIARALHANSARAARPFVAVNVAALPAELLESELFGHGKGAFTGADAPRAGLFEAADGGTLFLDELGEMPPALQAKLLRALQDGEIRRVGETRTFGVDVRVISATHRDLRERVAAGDFREDLYYRLAVLELRVPALRERRADVLPLARRFLGEHAGPRARFAADAEARLLAHAWPGNVRELENAVRHGAALADDGEVTAADLPALASVRRAAESMASLADVERAHIRRVLDACGGSQTEAARVLGIARNTLWRKLRARQPLG